MRNNEFDEGSGSQRELSEQDRAILDFAKTAPRHPGHLVNKVRETFDMGNTTYHQKLNRLLDHPAAMEYDPVTVKRYQRIRESRQARRRPSSS